MIRPAGCIVSFYELNNIIYLRPNKIFFVVTVDDLFDIVHTDALNLIKIAEDRLFFET